MIDSMKVAGHIDIKVYDNEGNLKDERSVDNTITNAGLAQIALLSIDATAVPFDYLALGIGTTASAATDTALESEIVDSGLARAQDATPTRTTTTVTNDTLSLNYSWTASGTKAVTECGILNAASAGTLLGHQVFAAINIVSGDALAVTYTVAFS